MRNYTIHTSHLLYEFRVDAYIEDRRSSGIWRQGSSYL